MKCQIPAFVRDYVKVTAWLKGDAIVATSLSSKGKITIFIIFIVLFVLESESIRI